MRDRLTLKSIHPPDQAADPEDRPSRTPGKRQPQELQTSNSHFEILVGFLAYKIAKSGSHAQKIDLSWSFCGISLTSSGQNENCWLQTAFLDGILNQRVTVYLVNGIKLIGQVRQHDPFTLQLQDGDGIDSLIFKHAISSIIPGAPVVTRERRTPFGKRPDGTG